MLSVGFVKNISRGFTLIEVLVVIAIISILAGVIAVNSADSNKQARDEKRQADLRALQSALEMYRNQDPDKKYPPACDSKVGDWAGQQGTSYACAGGNTQYIEGLAPKFIPVLPTDPKLNGSQSGYVYMVNNDFTIYKLMAMNTVESEIVTYNHPLKSCDINSTPNGINEIDTRGWCSYATLAANTPPGTYTSYDELSHCKVGNSRFEHSYGVWGGFAKLETTGLGSCTKTICAPSVRATAKFICK